MTYLSGAVYCVILASFPGILEINIVVKGKEKQLLAIQDQESWIVKRLNVRNLRTHGYVILYQRISSAF